ncbi:segregation and condensation protein A [Clostridia bacterium]|nr:segregation and condensation protein A [Clostridia bacterium]GHV34332.1 segregation and condensation protein A [Clostridia bacterium]
MDELTFRLEAPDFEGPLDLILQLLSKNKMTISDLKISEILDQYLAQVEEMNLDTASEFTVMASHLVYLKSRMLLNVGKDTEDEDMAMLLKALEERRNREEYEKILIAVAFLEPLSYIGRELFSRAPEQLVKEKLYTRTHDRSELKTAMAELKVREARRAPPERAAFRGILGAEPYPVSRKSEWILARLNAVRHMSMIELFREQGSRSELVAAFLAVLELCHDGQLTIDNGQLTIGAEAVKVGD